MDQTAIECIEEAMHLGLPVDVEAILLIETDGSDEGTVAGEIEAAGRISTENGARSVKVARTEAEREALWKARRSISPSLARKAPNKLGEDITVPRSAIPEIVQRLRAISARFGLPIVIFGHAGDGNLHPNILFDKRKAEEWKKVEEMVGEIFACRPGGGRDPLRRARRRGSQAALVRAGAGPRVGRGAETDQAGARSDERDEPGQDVPGLTRDRNEEW